MADHMAGLVQRARGLLGRGTIGVCLLGMMAPSGAVACRASDERADAVPTADRAVGGTTQAAPPAAAVTPSAAESVTAPAAPARETTAATTARARPDTAVRSSVRSSAGQVAAAPQRRDSAPARRDTLTKRDTLKRETTRRDTTTRDTTSRDTTAAPQAQGASGGDKLAVTPEEYQGWKIFAVNCTRCHGEDAIGSALAPSLVKSLAGGLTYDQFAQIVKKGRPEKGMPPWENLLTDEQIKQLYAYLQARAEGRLAPGRPHVKSGS
jgi:mono/diheme cytochrome c family protein